jgi:hypothetical protein
MKIVHSKDLTADEFRAISERHWPYDNFEEFWTGFADYQHDCNRRNRWPNSDAGEAWDRGTEAAMRVHWDRYSCMYARDCLDTRTMCKGLRAGIEEMKRKGTLPPRRARRKKATLPANDNAGPPPL